MMGEMVHMRNNSYRISTCNLIGKQCFTGGKKEVE